MAVGGSMTSSRADVETKPGSAPSSGPAAAGGPPPRKSAAPDDAVAPDDRFESDDRFTPRGRRNAAADRRALGTPGDPVPRGAPSNTGDGPVAVGMLPADADAELVELYRRARWLGGLGRDPLVSFSSLFLALLGGGTPIADWVQATAGDLQLTPELVLDRWASSKTYPTGITLAHVRAPQAPATSDGPDDITPSARAVIEAGVTYQKQLGAPALGARHVLAASLLKSIGHARDFAAWGVRPRAWAARLAVFLGRAYPDEADAWRSLCVRSDRPALSSGLHDVMRTALAIAGLRAAEAIDVEDVVRALLYLGEQWSAEEVSNVWLRQQLGEGLKKLQLPAAIPEVANQARVVDLDHLALTDEVKRWLETAQLWAFACSVRKLRVRHVVAALLAARGPVAGKRMLRNAGGAPTKLATEFAAMIRDREPSEDESTWQWLLAHDTPPRDRRKPGYASDIARGVDALDIEGDVHALASVLASVDTEPPLSVGLFGNWGSGKSFFMGKLRDHIQALAHQSCDAKQTAYCAEIAQIEFNAWHYIDGDLWASLVSHVLDSLEGYFRGDEKSLAEQRRVELATTQLKRAELEKRQIALDARRSKLEAAVGTYAVSGAEIAGAVGDEVARAVKDKAAESHAEVRKALDEVAKQLGVDPSELTLSKARQNMTALGAWWRQMTWQQLVIGAAFVAVGIAAAAAASWYQEKALAWIAALASVIAVIGRVLHVGLPIAKAAREAAAVGDRVAKQLARANPDIFAEQQRLEAAQTELTAERAQLDKRADELRAQLDAAKKPGMREYVLERATHYRDKLGIVAMVHRDFQNLSEQLRDQTTEPKLQRIILYIDDLDRCSPRRVVEMLQAIHLLLSFELFVVVVAVDPKWLLRSLEAYYAKQFPRLTSAADQDWESRPQFYLEKIFQIPYALQPMTAPRFDRMVASLLQSATAPERRAPQPVNDIGSGPTPLALTSAASADDDTAAPLLAAGNAPAPRFDLMPRNLEITHAELAHLRTLGPLVGSPRAAKRLANLYRIVRAGLDGDALDQFVDDRYQLTQIALAAVVGCPDLVCPWFRALLSRTTGDAAAVLAPLEVSAQTDPRARFLRDRVRACAEISEWSRVIEVCTLASRYSFETGALLALVPS